MQLSHRFQEAVDRAAMRAGKGSSDAYLADWARSAPRPCGDDLQAEASAEAARLEAKFTDEDSGAAGSSEGRGRERCGCRRWGFRFRSRAGFRVRLMYAVRLWSVRHARGLNAFYRGFEATLVRLDPLFRALGYERIERPVAAAERAVKSLLFDCRMCGQCVLSSTGMSCPMNCPKSLRNGPCGGVRADGNCEVKPDMKCVWVEAYRGSERIPGGVAAMSKVQFAVDQRSQGRSSWLRVAREKAGNGAQSGDRGSVKGEQ